jgi:hypothetical protein
LRLIDTNVVIYAAGKAHPLQDQARKVLDRIAEGSLHANVDVELLQEILHVYAARKERVKGFDTIDDLLVLFRTLSDRPGRNRDDARSDAFEFFPWR